MSFQPEQAAPLGVEPHHRGAHAELRACAWLLEQGYEVFRNISPSGPADMMVLKYSSSGVETIQLDVKSGTISVLGVLNSGSLSARQKALGIRKLVVTKSWIGWEDDWAVAFPVCGRMKPPRRTNECGHPERPHEARGMCVQCYVANRQQFKHQPTETKKTRLNAIERKEIVAAYTGGDKPEDLAVRYNARVATIRAVLRAHARSAVMRQTSPPAPVVTSEATQAPETGKAVSGPEIDGSGK